MPKVTPFTKITRTETLGAHVVLTGATLTEATATAARLAARDGRDARSRVRRCRGDRGPGHGRVGDARAAARSRGARGPGRWRRPGRRHGGRREGRAPRCRDRRRADGEVRGDGRRARPKIDRARGGATIAEGIAVTEPGVITTEIVDRARRPDARRARRVDRRGGQPLPRDREGGRRRAPAPRAWPRCSSTATSSPAGGSASSSAAATSTCACCRR